MPVERRSDVMVFIVETAKGTKEEQKKIEAAVDHLALQAGGDVWRVEPLIPEDEDPSVRLRRFIRVSGRVDAPPHHWDKIAFDIAYRLEEASGYKIYPDLPSSTFMPSTRRVSMRDPLNSDNLESFGSRRSGARLPFDWALQSVRAPQAWALAPKPGGHARGATIVVAHPDTGYTKPPGLDLKPYDLDRDFDFLDEDDDAHDPLEQTPIIPLYQPGHGTSSSSVIVGNVLPDIRGVAPDARLVPLRTIKSVVQVFDSDVARAVNYARKIEAHVISMSLGGDWFIGLEEAIEDAIEDGLIVLAAAGNKIGAVVAPAAYPACIAVSASNVRDGTWPEGSRGRKVAVCAPGEDVWAAEYFFTRGKPPAIGKDQQSGTTFAVAMTAGVAALWLAHWGRDNLIATYGKARLQPVFLHMVKTVGHRTPAGWDTNNYGVGIIDAEALLKADLPAPSEVPALPSSFLEAVGRLKSGEGEEAASVPVPERLLALFPDFSPNEIWLRFQQLFRVDSDTLLRILDQRQAELARIFSEQPAAWNAFTSLEPVVDEVPNVKEYRLSALALIVQHGSTQLVREVL